jgi:single-strand DNA-binding protein
MVNKVTLLGRLTRDVELKILPTGVPVANFSLATNRVWFDKNTNQKQEETEFHNCQAWNKTAENIAKYVKKGHLLYIEGRITTRSWDDKTTGEKKYRTEIIVEEMKLLPNNDGRSHIESDNKPKVEGRGVDTESIDYGDSNVNVDDIPF